MKSFIEVIKEADETQARLKFIQDPKSSSKSIANLARSEDLVVRNAAEEELKRRRDSGDQDAAAHVQPPKDASIHTAQTQVGGEQAQAQEKETKTKEVDPNRIAPVKKGSGKDILNNLRKGKTISGDAPNSIELNPQYIIRADGIKEAAMKSVVFSFGRMNPPTVGHEKLVDKIQAVAKANKADARLFLSRTEGDDKNPLPYSDKLKLAKMAFPGIVQDTPKSMYPAGFIGLLKMLEDKYDKVIIVVGSDRLPNIKALANKYNGSEYKFEEIEVVSAGERDPDEEGVSGMSASKMRAAAKAGDLAKFKSGLPSRLKSAAKLVMDKLQSYLSEDLDEAVLTLSQRLKRRSQFRRARGKIILGQKRARARKASSKQISRRSKRIAIKLIRKRILRNRKYQDLSYGARAAVDRQVARRKSAIARIAKRIEPRLRQAENRRKSGGGYASISLSGPVKKKKLKEEITYDNLIHSVNAIMKRIIAEENYSLAPLEQASLVRKSNETGVPVKVIKEVYTRGVASWNMGLREDTTPQQWGFARVNSFLAGGFNARTADRDLLEAKDPEQVKKNLLQKIESDETYPLRSLWNHTRNNDQEISDAAHAAIEARAKAGDSNAAQAADALKQQKQGAMPASGQQTMTPDFAQTGQMAASTAGVILKGISAAAPKVNQQDDEESQLFAQHASGEMTDDELHQSIADKTKGKEPKFLEDPYKGFEPNVGYLQSSPGKKDYLVVSPGSTEALEQLNEIDKDMRNSNIPAAVKQQHEMNLNSRKQILEDRKKDLPKKPSKKQEGSKNYEEIKKLYENGERERARIDKEIREINATFQVLQMEGHWNNALRTESFDKVDSTEQVLKGDKLKSAVNAMSAKLAEIKQIAKKVCVADKLDKVDGSPGKASSNMGELVSINVVADLLSEGNIDPSSKEAKPEIARRMLAMVGDGKSGFLKQLESTGGEKITAGEMAAFRRMCKQNNVNIPSSINETQLKQLIYTHRMAYGKLVVAHDDLNGAGLDPKNVVTIGVTGSARGKQQAAETFKMLRDNGVTHINGGNGRKIPIDLAERYAREFGAGDNPGDTVILSIDKKTGQASMTLFSDKQDAEAQFGNTTLLTMADDAETRLLAYKKAGKIDEAGYAKAIEHLNSVRKTVENNVSDIQQQDFHFAGRVLDGKVNDWIKAAKNISGGSYYDQMESLYDPNLTPMLKGETKIEAVLRACKDAANSGDREMLGYLKPAHEILSRTSKAKFWKETPGHAKEQLDNLDNLVNKVTGTFGDFADKTNKIDPNNANLGQEIINHIVLTNSGAAHYYEDALSPLGDPSSAGMFHTQVSNDTMSHDKMKKVFGADNFNDLIEQSSTTSSASKSNEGRVSGLSVHLGVYNTKTGDGSVNVVDADVESSSAIRAAVKMSIREKGEAGKYNIGHVWTSEAKKIISPDSWQSYYDEEYLQKESFLSFGDFLQESTDKAVGNQPTVNPKPIHHKASGHKYHVHHMVNPNLGMMHQVKHAVDRKDLDIDGDTDEFDKPKAGIPDEIGVGTTPTTKKMFAKYSKELSHIHAGEPVDEQKITPKYTGDENSWYIDASGQKVQVYSQSDLKHPEDVGKFLKNPTPEKDIGKMMSMKDFLKTQPEKKK